MEVQSTLEFRISWNNGTSHDHENDDQLIVVTLMTNRTHVPGSKLIILGMVIPPLIGILIMGPYKPLLNWVEFPIPYYMQIMGVETLAHMEHP